MKKRPLWIKIYGIALIVMAILTLINMPIFIRGFLKNKEIFSILFTGELLGLSVPITIFLAVGVIGFIFAVLQFFICLIAGIGIWRVKIWARYLVLLSVTAFIIANIWSICLFGPQLRSFIDYSLWTLLAIFTIAFFNTKYVKKYFGTGLKKISLLPKILLSILIIEIVFFIVSVPLFTLYMTLESRKLPVAVNAEVERITYQAKYSELERNNYEKRILFGYSIYLPKDIIVISVSEDLESQNWEIVVIDKVKNKDVGFALFLDSKSFSEITLFPIGKHFNFKSSYEFEKFYNSPNWMRIYSTLKFALTLNSLERTEEGISSNWKGFISMGHPKEGNKRIFVCSIYDNDYKSSAGITLIVKDEIMTPDQVRDMIASLEFEADNKDEFEFFDQGKKALSNKDYTDATINFINALYANKENSQYAYYLAKALFKNDNEIRRKPRLKSSKDFLEYALNLNPNYEDAKKLLITVDKEITALREETLSPK